MTGGATGDPLHPPVPPISSRDAPRFGSEERRRTLAGAFEGQGADYDRLRPGYPEAVLDAMLEPLGARPRRAVDLGAGTGKLSWALVERGLEVTAVDTSDIAQMGYEQARDELASIVSTLESGRTPLEESMRLWERGEALADHCSTWLDGAQSRIEDAAARREGRDGEGDAEKK